MRAVCPYLIFEDTVFDKGRKLWNSLPCTLPHPSVSLPYLGRDILNISRSTVIPDCDESRLVPKQSYEKSFDVVYFNLHICKFQIRIWKILIWMVAKFLSILSTPNFSWITFRFSAVAHKYLRLICIQFSCLKQFPGCTELDNWITANWTPVCPTSSKSKSRWHVVTSCASSVPVPDILRRYEQ
jgi:hypothetical protein